jgi:hypothetical protein
MNVLAYRALAVLAIVAIAVQWAYILRVGVLRPVGVQRLSGA